MNESTDRRTVVKALAVGSAGLALGHAMPVSAQAKTVGPVKITDLEMLGKGFVSKEFTFADEKCLLVRLPVPKDAIKNKRILETTHKGKDGKTQTLYLTAYTRVCTHLGCTPALPDGAQQMACPCHGSIYALDGSVIQGPAERPLQAIKLEVNDGAVMATALLDDK
jgi:cytochrome b6-f complex iron-sulfur subunit